MIDRNPEAFSDEFAPPKHFLAAGRRDRILLHGASCAHAGNEPEDPRAAPGRSADSQRRSREKARAKREEARAARAKTTAVSPLRARAAEKIDALAKSLFAVADMDLFLDHLPMFNKILAEARRVADLAQEVKNLEDAEHRTPGP